MMLTEHPKVAFPRRRSCRFRGIERLRCHGGSASPLGLIFPEARGVGLIVDSALRQTPTLAFHPCDNTRTVAMKAEDFFDRFLPEVGVEVAEAEF